MLRIPMAPWPYPSRRCQFITGLSPVRTCDAPVLGVLQAARRHGWCLCREHFVAACSLREYPITYLSPRDTPGILAAIKEWTL